MNAKELTDRMRKCADSADSTHAHIFPDEVYAFAHQVEQLTPRYRPPQLSDDGRWCFLEELPSDAPPTLVRSLDVCGIDDQGHYRRIEYSYWTVAGWRELTKGVWPCERPEGGGA